MDRFSDTYAVCRFGDDLGYKSSTILNPNDIKTFIIPQYERITYLVHSYNKPFLLHSCGNIFRIMCHFSPALHRHFRQYCTTPYSLANNIS